MEESKLETFHANIEFRGGNEMKTFLTLTEDGRLIPGPGLSMDEATQQAAEMLVKHYNTAMTKSRGEE